MITEFWSVVPKSVVRVYGEIENKNEQECSEGSEENLNGPASEYWSQNGKKCRCSQGHKNFVFQSGWAPFQIQTNANHLPSWLLKQKQTSILAATLYHSQYNITIVNVALVTFQETLFLAPSLNDTPVSKLDFLKRTASAFFLIFDFTQHDWVSWGKLRKLILHFSAKLNR